MEYNDEDLILYVPELGDNRDLDEKDQVSCELLPMTGEELRAYQRVMVGVKPGSSQALKKAEQVIKRIISERVVRIENYSDIKGGSIETGEELFQRGEPPLIDELYEALSSISKLREGQRKN
jgi:hypothetical protein